MFRIRDKSKTPPKGFRFIDPETLMLVEARNYANWITLANDHRVANNLPLPDEGEMEAQLCGSYDDRTRADVCEEYDASGAVKRRGVGSTLKRMLAAGGVNACFSCYNLAAKMDSWGPSGCEDHMAEIVDVMNENAIAHKWMRHIPFRKLGAEALVRLAIHQVRVGLSTQDT